MILEYNDQYEYMSPNLSGLTLKEIVNKFNKLGKEGWEVIVFNRFNNNIGILNYQALLKRKIIVTKV